MIRFLQNNLAELSAYSMLMTSFISFWVTQDKKVPLGFFILSLFLGLLFNQINALALLPIILITICLYWFYYKNPNNLIKLLLFFLILITTILLFSHQLPGYNNWQIFSNLKLSKNSSYFSLWFNFDKPMIGFLLLLLVYKPIRSKEEYLEAFSKEFIFLFLISILVIIIFGILTSYLSFDLKRLDDQFLILWLIKMLFFTVIVEEVFFRLFIQENIIGVFSHSKHKKTIGLVSTSFLFGLCHLPIGLTFAFLAFISGLLYGGIFLKTNRLESSILLHFTVNFIHLICFSYPSKILIL